MTSLFRRIAAWIAWAVPTDEALETQDTPELREFWNRIEENRAIARRQLEEVHSRNSTRSPIHRKAS